MIRTELIGRIKNRHGQRPVDLLPPPAEDKESDDEKVRAALRQAEAEAAIASSGDVVHGELGACSARVLGEESTVPCAS
jgi:hypothetical protein